MATPIKELGDWKPTTQNETRLVDILSSKVSAIENLNVENSALLEKLRTLEERIKSLEHKNKDKTEKEETETRDDDFWTDDEQLSNETEWIRVKNTKKRRMAKSATPPTPVKNIVETPKKRKEPSPPPIIIDKVEKFDVLHENLLNVVKKEDFTLKLLKNDGAKINPISATAHREITAELNRTKLAWYSFENKQSRPFRVMIKGLHHTIKPDDIIEDLKIQGLQAIDAVNKIGWKSKNPLDMFIVSFNCEEDQSKISNIKYVMNLSVEVESLRSTKLIPQCKRCQGYGHTQKYCARETRCVKCVGIHLTVDCDRPKENKPKCCHCGDEHPANYRGCLIAKELQKIKDNKNDKREKTTNLKSNNKKEEKTESINSKIKQAVSYAQTTKKSAEATNLDKISNTLNDILNKFKSFDERLTKLEKSLQGSIPKILNKNEQKS